MIPLLAFNFQHCKVFIHTTIILCFQHLIGHHPYTNIESSDPDLYTGKDDVR